MAIASPAELLHALRQCRLLDPGQLEELSAGPLANLDGALALARALIQRGWLTPYQVNQLFQGRGPDLLLGSYILLERLGEGSMGQVFKARNWKLGTVVAVKLIHKQRLGVGDVVRRFHREIRAAAQLNHGNIVRAYDADEVGGTLLLVMEYVENGIDLSRLVKSSGPLPVNKACDYIRQAALGLQHAFEHGLVHRDIKPANLLLTGRRDVVKVLDMGLARLDNHASTESLGTMTRQGVIMGTPEFIAPEQARDSHLADTRSDLYSLGCSFYYLLCGRPPFRGKTLLEVVLKHSTEEAVPVEQLRPEVPPAVAAIMGKLMAKRPEQRYQTPAEAAAALASVPAGPLLAVGATANVVPRAVPVADLAAAVIPAALVPAPMDTEAGWSSIASAPPPESAAGEPPSFRLRARRPRRRRLVIASGLLAAGLVLGLIVFLVMQRPHEKLPARPAGAAATIPSKRVMPATKAVPKGKAVTLYWNMADDADIYLNGKPLREYQPDFRTRRDEAPQEFDAQVVLAPGDVFTVGGRRGGSYGLWLVAIDDHDNVVWWTDTEKWKVYQPVEAESWYLPEVALRSPSAAVIANPQPWRVQRAMRQRFGGAEAIWSNPADRFAYLYSVVR